MKIIEELPLELCVFELRYNPMYILWDNMGSIWDSMIAANPALKLSVVQPNQQIFETESLQITLDISVLRVSGRGPNAIAEVANNANILFKIACDKVKLDSFTRAGFRFIKSKTFPSPAHALKFANIAGTEETAALGKEGKKIGFVTSTRFESDSAGLLAGLRVEEREWNFMLPWESRPLFSEKLSGKSWALVSDVDYYTIGVIAKESLDVEMWVNQAIKAIQLYWSEV